MKEHLFRRSVALLMSLALLGQSSYAAEIIDGYTPDYKYFENTDVPQDYQDQNLFWFGSTDMTVSEKDPDYYVMRVLRSGSCDSEASITVKFTDVTADYGENYTVWSYDDHTEPVSTGDAPAMVDFIQENMDTLTEEDPYTEDDLVEAMESKDGVDMVDGLGETIANLSLSDLTDEDGASEVASEVTVDAEAADGELDGVIDASDYTAIDSETESLFSDDYPGHELTLDFAAGETEKLIVVDPKYSSSADGDCTVTASLKNPSAGMAYEEDSTTASITITDEDPQTPATLAIEQTEYFADSDTITVTITRTGAINNMVCANLVTSSDEAEMGVDYQGADAKVYFPMGFTRRTVELQVNHIRDEQLTFQVKLVNPAGCELGNAEATVTIATAEEAETAALEAQEAEESGSTGLIPENTAASVTLASYETIYGLYYKNAIAGNAGAAAETTAAAEATTTGAAAAETTTTESSTTGDETTAADSQSAGTAEASLAEDAEASGTLETVTEEAQGEPEADTDDSTVISDYSDVPVVDSADTEAPAGTGVADSDEDETASLLGVSDRILLTGNETRRLGEQLSFNNFTAFTKVGNGWMTDMSGYQYFYSCKGVSADTWNGLEYTFKNPYLYDGVRVKIDGHHDGWGSTSYTHITIDGTPIWETEDTNYSAVTVDSYFTDSACNKTLGIAALTSYFNGVYGTVYSLKPILRKFNFQLSDPEEYALTYEGTDSATAMTYTATTMNEGKHSLGEQLTITGTDTHGYAKLFAVQFLDADGDLLWMDYNDSSNNVNTITVDLTEQKLNYLATKDVEYVKDSSTGCYVGQIKVRPIYVYVESDVTIQPSVYGQFTGDYAVTSATKKTLHLGDRITLRSEVYSTYDGKYVADGVGYQKYSASGDAKAYDSGRYDYLTDETTSLTITIDAPKMVLYPAFTGVDNAVEVRVKRSDVSKLSTDSLLLKYSYTVDGDYYVYTVTDKSVHVDSIVQVSAEAKDSSQVPLWTVGNETWSGNGFAFTTSRDKNNNTIYLTLGTAKKYNMYGYAYNGDRNLSMLNSVSEPIIPASNAAVVCADIGAYPDDNGYFEVSGVVGSPNTKCRVVIYSNNAYTIKDVLLTGSAINLGKLQTSVNTMDTARFTGITVMQNGAVVTSIGSLALNSKTLVLTASVADGNKYTLNGKECTETATGVTFYILDGTTHAIKYTLPARSNHDGSWSASIEKFSPDQPDNWYYGDLIYAELTTDRVQGAGLDNRGNMVVDIPTTTYAMLSTGYMIAYSDDEVESQTISFDPKVDADSVLGGAASLSADTDSTNSGRSTKSFTSIPFLGGINVLLGVTGGYIRWGSGVYGDPTDDDIDTGGTVPDDEDEGTGSYKPSHATSVKVKFTCTIEELAYGGYRLKIGVTAYTGNQAALTAAANNPYQAYKIVCYQHQSAGHTESDSKKLLYDSADIKHAYRGTYGTPRMTVSVTLGIYLDFGLVSTISDESGEVESSVDGFVFLGAGGYLGLSGSVQWLWAFIGPFGLPMYTGLIGSASVMGYIGGTADLNEALTYAKPFGAITDKDGNFDLNKLNFNVDVVAEGNFKGYWGLGCADVLGGRIIVGLGVAYEYCPALQNYYAGIDDSWGFSVNFTLGGQIDLLFVSIPISGFSIPLTSKGFTEYFTYVRRTYRLWDYIHEELETNSSKYSEEQIAQLNTYMDQLVDNLNTAESTDIILKYYNEAYNYACGIGALSATEKSNLALITDFDVWTLEDDGSDSTASGESTVQEVTEDGYMLMQHTNSEWVANDSAALSGSFTEAATKTLVKDSYSQPNASMAEIGNNKLLSIYLSDTSDTGEIVDPTLVYSIYDETTGVWTDPEPIADDGTADYTPSLCDAGDKVVITWSSAGIASTSSNAKEVLESMDIWEVTFDKASQTMSEPILLTEDDNMDYNSSIIYDDETGDITVYYVKSTVTSETDNILNFITGNSVLCYRLYDADTQSWLIDYTKNEYASYSEEQLHEYGVKYNGQRFLSSVDGSDNPITDLTVCTGYNGLGIYAYTVDADGDSTDTSDTELYMRVFDFRTYKTYAPIRITNDSVSQAEPQLVRTTGSYTDTSRNADGTTITVNGATYLFWLEDGDTVNYINVTDLLRHGINEDGTLKDGALDYCATPISFMDGANVSATVANYQAIADDDNNLYLVWSQAVESEDEAANDDINTPAPQEVFASAMVQEDPEAYNAETGEGGSNGSSWSDPVRMTTGEGHNDGATGIIGSDGNLYMLHTEYDITYVDLTGNTIDEETGCIEGNPYIIGDTDLCFSSFTPVASMEATEFTYSDDTPAPGETIQITVKLENTGLTTAKGYTATIAESRNGITDEALTTVTEDNWICAAGADYVTFDWTVPDDFDQVNFVCTVTETGYSEPLQSYSEPLEKTDAYEVSIGDVTQTGDTFTATYTLTNTGSCTAAEGTVLCAEFEGLYGNYSTLYGLDTDLLSECSIAGLKPGESVSGSMEFAVPEQAFDYCGYDQVNLTVYDSDDNALSETVGNDLVLETPIHTSLTGDTCLLPGETTTLTASMKSEFFTKRGCKMIYTSSDNSVLSVSEDGTVTAVGTGTATITATFSPYGVDTELDITVTKNRKFVDVPKSQYYAGPVYWAVEQGIVTGITSTTFFPNSGCTRAQFITLLWRAAGSPDPTSTTSKFTDVQNSSLYFYKAVLWGAEKGIVNGTSETTFSPDQTCTRAQATTFLWRYAGKPTPESAVGKFDDVNASQYYYEATLWGAENGIVKGTGTTTFTPDAICTRAQAVTFLYRLLQKSSS